MTKVIKKPGLVNALRMCVQLASRRKWDQQLSHIKMKGALMTIWMRLQQLHLPWRMECSTTRQELKHQMNLLLQVMTVICQWIKWWQTTKKPKKLSISGRLRIHSFMWVCNQLYSSANYQVCSNSVWISVIVWISGATVHYIYVLLVLYHHGTIVLRVCAYWKWSFLHLSFIHLSSGKYTNVDSAEGY